MRTIEGKGEFKEILGVWGHTHLFQSCYVDGLLPHWDLASDSEHLVGLRNGEKCEQRFGFHDVPFIIGPVTVDLGCFFADIHSPCPFSRLPFHHDLDG